MSKKQFDEYFNNIYFQYLQLQRVLEDMSKEVEENIIPPERIEELKKTIQPVKSSYETLLYVKYLLDMPQRKSKVKKYERQELSRVKKKSGDNFGTEVLNRNKSIIKDITLL